MPQHPVTDREAWLTARRALLEREKAHTRAGDALTAARQALPWVRVDTEYVFASPDGPRTLAELFDGRSQLIVQHFMFDPAWDEGCTGCSGVADGVEGSYPHLRGHDVSLVRVSRAPLEQLLAYQERMGWTVPWVSSHDSTFNFDFDVSGSPERPLRAYNFGRVPDGASVGEVHGMSTFVLEDGEVFHHYSAHARGLDAVWGVYQWLDRAPRGRNEDGENWGWQRRRDRYEVAAT